MYEIIKQQFDSKKSLSQSKYHHILDQGKYPLYYWDLHPINQNYYHELNPNFVFSLYRPEFFKFGNVCTVKDGYLTFAQFLIDNFADFEKVKTGLFLIHPDLAPLIPPSLSDFFATWNLVQPKRINIQNAKKIIVFGLLNEEYLGNINVIEKKISSLKAAPVETPIEIYLPQRRSAFDTNNRENVFLHESIGIIQETLAGRSVKYLNTSDFNGISDFKNVYVLDLAQDNFIIADSYIDFIISSKGGTTSRIEADKRPADSIFHFDLSLYHEFHVCPLPKTKNVFAELLFYKKKKTGMKDFVKDPGFQSLLINLLRNKA